MPGRTEPRLFAYAASVVSGAGDRYMRARTRHPRRRNAPAQLHPTRRISLHHAEWLRLRLRKLSQDAGGCQAAHRLGRVEEKAGGCAKARPADWHWHWYDA